MAQVWKPNVTVAAIIEQQGRFLLVEEETDDGLRLNNPAGHLEPGESPAQAVVREAAEETGRTFVPRSVVGVYLSRSMRAGVDVTYLRFAFRGDVGDPWPNFALDQGIVRTLWMTPDELRAAQDRHRSPLVLQCVNDYLAGKSYPLDLISTHQSVYSPGLPTSTAPLKLQP